MLYDVHLARDIKGNKKQFCKCFGNEGKKRKIFSLVFRRGDEGKTINKRDTEKAVILIFLSAFL